MDQKDNLSVENEDVVEVIEPIDAAEPTDIQSTEKKPRLPIVCIVIYAIAALCAILYVAFLLSPEFSDFFNKNVSPFIRVPLAMLTGWIPFSLAELMLLFAPFAVVALVAYGIKKYSSSWRHAMVYCLTILSLAAYVFSTFTLGFVPAYRGSRLDQKMGLDKQPVSAEELYDTAAIVVTELNELHSKINYSESTDFSVMPYGYDELNRKLLDAYEVASEKYDFINTFDSRVKRVMLSEPMTYTHISGVYTFFTGEANLNTNFPDYTLPFTAAHELAHQRGIAREDEANFVAFLVCICSDDDYIRYSGYLNLYEYLAGPLSRANKDYYAVIYYAMPENILLEMKAYSKFFDKYRENIAEKVSEKVNDSFLTINGTEGTKSYGMVVDLAVAYYKDKD
ncbi:MAG: DUF3810 domain-containing protein [Clostridia bacterium]|nr:DUF3810 domain-containing protein [Clostridia bacterium]